MAPLVVVLVTTTILPIGYMVALALGDEDGDLGITSVQGVANFGTALASGALWRSVALAVEFLVGALAIEIVLGVSAALLLDRLVPRNPVVRMLLLWPAVLPPIAVALVFKYLLQGDIGLVSYYLSAVGIDQAWLTQAESAMGVIIAVDVWQYTPFVILLTLAALAGFPPELREAAHIDGAGPLTVIRYVVLPVIAPAIVAITLLRFIDAIQVFPTIYVLTRGGPGSSTQLLTYFNYQVFFGELRFGLGAAIAVLVVVFTMACVVMLLALQRRMERAL
ncbi:MAG: ABC transporter permease subunit [Streptosporangiales bacterium]|nr:ABC transporter permease subunit [Streptosporangiales bacterium]